MIFIGEEEYEIDGNAFQIKNYHYVLLDSKMKPVHQKFVGMLVKDCKRPVYVKVSEGE